MKKTFFLLSMLAGVLTAQAQVSDNATVNVKLYPIQTISKSRPQSGKFRLPNYHRLPRWCKCR